MRYLKIGSLIIIIIFVSAYLFHYYFVSIKDPYITGYVTDKKHNKVLVVSSEGELGVQNILGIEYPENRASWIRTPLLNRIVGRPQVGQKVDVAAKGIVLMSYPSKVMARKIYTLPSPQYPDANISEKEAIELSLSVLNHRIRAIKNIDFNKAQGRWSVILTTSFPTEPGELPQIKVLIDDLTGEFIEIIDSKK